MESKVSALPQESHSGCLLILEKLNQAQIFIENLSKGQIKAIFCSVD